MEKMSMKEAHQTLKYGIITSNLLSCQLAHLIMYYSLESKIQDNQVLDFKNKY